VIHYLSETAANIKAKTKGQKQGDVPQRDTPGKNLLAICLPQLDLTVKPFVATLSAIEIGFGSGKAYVHLKRTNFRE
jgi:hypothetical protein